jgi:hypothetical protein
MSSKSVRIYKIAVSYPVNLSQDIDALIGENNSVILYHQNCILKHLQILKLCLFSEKNLIRKLVN